MERLNVTVILGTAVPELSIKFAVRILYCPATTVSGFAAKVILYPAVDVCVLVMISAPKVSPVAAVPTVAPMTSCTLPDEPPDPAVKTVEKLPLASVVPLDTDKVPPLLGVIENVTGTPMAILPEQSFTVTVTILLSPAVSDCVLAVNVDWYPEHVDPTVLAIMVAP